MAWALSHSGVAVFTDGDSGHVYLFSGGSAAAGSLIVLGVNSNTVVSTPSGYAIGVTDVNQQGAYVFYKTSTGESSVTFTTNGNHKTAISYLNYSGSTPTPLDQVDKVRVTFNASPQASPAVAPSTLTDTDELSLLFAMNHKSTSGASQSGATASSGYSVLGDTGVSGSYGDADAVQHYVIGRTTASGLQTPSVSWTGGAFENRTALFVSFLKAAEPSEEAAQHWYVPGRGTVGLRRAGR